ncbi:MAG: hypothetical protein WC964_00090 [Acholeplasmataceae bacterium]
MTRENRWLIINAAIILIVGALAVLAYHFLINIPSKPQNQLFGVKVTLTNKVELNAEPSSGEYALLIARYDAMDGNRKIGDVFYAKGTNGYTYEVDDDFGVIELYIGIDTDGKVSVQVLNARQTRDRVPAIYDFVKLRLQDVGIENIEAISTAGGNGLVAGATHSRTLVKTLVTLAVNEYKGVEPDPYEDWFGEGYQLEEKVDLTGEYLQSKQVVKNSNGDIIGSIYVVEGKSVYHSSSEGTIRMHVGLDDDGKVIGYHFEVYEHTNGFRPDVIAYLNAEVLNTNINDFEEDEGISTGATNSSRLVIRMLTELKSEVTSA